MSNVPVGEYAAVLAILDPEAKNGPYQMPISLAILAP